MDNPYEMKVINLLKKKGSLMNQEGSAPFFLSVILEDFISEHDGDSRYASELSFAKRLDSFILDEDKFLYYDA